MANQNTQVYSEIYIDTPGGRDSDIVVSGSRPNTGYTIVVAAGAAKCTRWKFCPPVFTSTKQTMLKVDPAIALTNLLWGKCACGYSVKDFASVVMGHKKSANRDLICPLCQAEFAIRRCDVVLVGDEKDPAKDVIYGGLYAKEAYQGLLFNSTNPAMEELVLPKLWFGYKPSEAPLPTDVSAADLTAAAGLCRNHLSYYAFDKVRAIHYKEGAPSVRSLVLEARARTGMTTIDALSGNGLSYSRCFFRQLYGR